MQLKRWYGAIDVHSGGQPLRIITGGLPPLAGATLLEKGESFREHYDMARRLLLAEPRGHYGMTGAVVTAPMTEGAKLGLLFLNQQGQEAISGTGIFGVMTAWLATGQLSPEEAAAGLRVDCPAGSVKAMVKAGKDQDIDSVTVQSVPSLAYAGPIMVCLQGSEVRVDIAYSGEFYAVVDISSLWRESDDTVPLAWLREWASTVRKEVEARHSLKHPLPGWKGGVYGVFFYRKATLLALAVPKRRTYRSTTVFGGDGGQVDRSPGGTGICAHLAVLQKRGLLHPGEEVLYRGISGGEANGSITAGTTAYGCQAVLPQITGDACVLGFMNFVLDPSDPFAEGFTIY
ncbi:proline racemase family protein [Paenibacillus sanguinis]|uniref:proline racemase family protein n=1 Tax=Paenibacillus sanguinis TaxID=225906 RepID=UPI0003807DBE|nr:proline racemase family protein [Paenibacillus sanguinis]